MPNQHSLLVKTRFFHLKLVLTIAEFGTIHKAADALNMTQPAATRSLKELEAQLGAPLFERSHQGMKLNLFGERFAAHARVLLNQLKAATDDLSEVMSGGVGHVKIGALPAAAANLVPKAITRLQEKELKISITIEEGTISHLLPMLLNGNIDLLIGRMPSAPQGVSLIQTPLFYDSFSIVCGTQNPLLKRKKYKLKDLIEEEWIFPTPRTSLLMADVRETFNQARLTTPKPSLEISSLQSIRNVLKNTNMISFLSSQVALEEERHGLLSVLPVHFKSVLTPIGITCRSESEMAPATDIICNIIQEIGQEMLEDGQYGLNPL